VTQQIKALESHFNATLLERTNRGVEPTAAGQIVFAYANRVVQLTEGLEQKMRALDPSSGGELVVGASSTVGGYAVPCTICLFKERYPEATLKLRVGNRNAVLNWLRRGDVSVALVEGEPFRGPFTRRSIIDDELALIAPADGDPWEGRTEISVPELLKAPFIMREPGSGTREVIERALAPTGVSLNDLNAILELDHVDSVKVAVEAGRGVSVVSMMAIRREIRTGSLRTVRVKGVEFKQKIYLAWQEDRAQTRLERLFVSFVRSPHRGFC